MLKLKLKKNSAPLIVLALLGPMLTVACNAAPGGAGQDQQDRSALEATVQSSPATVIGLPLAGNANVAPGLPAGGNHDVLLSRKQYVLAWNARTRIVDWAAWRLSTKDLGEAGRQNSFAVDTQLADFLARSGGGAEAVTSNDYQDSCMDRGHQVPSADRTANAQSNGTTFFMSNMVPQTSFLNRTAWAHMEDFERDLVKGADEPVFLVAGPVFGRSAGAIGPDHDIAVPTRIFKIIYKPGARGGKATILAAALMPNTTSDGTDPLDDRARECEDQRATPGSGSTDDWKRFSASVGEIEAASGLKFAYLH